MRGILFDLDGVLVDSRAAWYATLDEILRAEGLPAVPVAVFDAAFGQSSEEDARRFFAGHLTRDALDARYAEVFPRHVGSVRLLESGTPRLLERLSGRRLHTAITTNAPAGTAHAMLAAAGLEGSVETIVTPDDVERPKPAPDMLIEACRRLSVHVSDVILVGDSSSDIGAGRAAGVTVVGYRTDGGAHRVERLEEILDIIDADART